MNGLRGIALAAITTSEAIKVLINFVLALGDSVGGVGDVFNGFAKGLYLDLASIGQAMQGNLRQSKVFADQAGQAVASGWEAGTKRIQNAWAAAKVGVEDSVLKVGDSLDKLFGTFSNVSAGADTTAKSLGHVTPPLIANKDAADAAAKALDDYSKAQIAAGTFLSKMQGGLDPLNKAYQDYVQTVIQANKISQQLIETGNKAGKATEAYAAAQAFMAKAVGLANQSLDEQQAKLDRQGDILGRLQQEYADQSAMAQMTDRQRFIAEAVQKATDEWTKNADALIKNKQTLDEVQKGAAAAAASTYDLTEAAKQSRAVAQEFTSIWTNAGNSIADAFSKWVVEGGSLMKSLTDIAKQVVEQIIAYFAKLAIINPILNAIFGGSMIAGGGSLLPVLGSVGGAVIGGSSGGGGTDLFGTANGGISLFTAGKQIWNGFSTAAGNFWYGTHGTVDYSSGLGVNMPGQGSAGYTGAYGGYGSGFGQALGIGGALYAGYNRYQQGGALGGAAGGITYGVGTYAAGAGLASAAAGTGFAAGVSGAFAAIPVVGWIALAAMLVDMISGGKLFGTDANKLVGGGSTLSIGAGGADVASHYTLKGQKPLFGGSYYEEHAYTDQAAVDAANQFFAQLKSGTEDFAKQFGVTMGDIVGGTFEQTFDKHGNVTSSSSTVNGVTYDNDTVQQFQERIVAENELAILGQFDDKLSEAIDKYRQNADDLYAITNDLATAQLGFNQGLTFLALGSDQSTSALLHLAETSQHFGETVDQTLQRLMAAQAQYDQFVGQFKPATNYVDDFEGTLSQINQQMQANIKQANALAQAAGAAGASEQDLANIHKYAAQQAQQAFAALQASAQSLAFSLGLTTIGSLDQVNAEIERLQAKANTSSNAVRDFGQAMQTAADNAKHAMDLLLGDLSPLNDQQKLQKALEGLRAGTVTQDQVLEIGRRLYSSTAQYTALFNMVQAMGGSGAATQIGGAGFGGGGGGLSAAESQRLHDLLKQQQQLQAAAQLQQYQTLAQQVAEIASFKGEDWHQVLKDMGIDIADFEKGLGLNEKQTEDYITAIQKQTDDNGENTASIVAVLIQIRDAITGTPPTSDGDANGNGPAGGAGHSGHGSRGRNFSDDDADAFGRAVARHSNHAARPRSERPPTSAATTR
jgi:cobalamin biosynthesis Co2+ chelatase CbiK